MRIVVADHAGVCYGVERALKLAEQAADTDKPVHTLGPLIHNPQVVQSLIGRGVEVTESLDELDEGVLVIRSHGVDPALIEAAHAKKLEVVDATCPFVSAAHQCARELVDEGYSVIIVGEADHPEVEGILAHAGGEAIVIEEAGNLPADLPSKKLGVVVQTTQSLSRLNEVVAALLPRVKELRVCNTICGATGKRQDAAARLADTVDAVVVVGGHNSGNTNRLAEICRSRNERVYHVERPDELEGAMFEGLESVGVTGGASTPHEQMEAVIETLRAFGDSGS